MSILEIRPFEAWHLEGMDIRSEPLLESMRYDIIDSASKGIAFTGFLRSTPLGCAGISPLWEGVGEAWCFFAPPFYPNYRGVVRTMIREFRRIACPFERVQTLVRRSGTPTGLKFAQMFGFQTEGFMRNYYRGEDYFMMALFPKEEGWCGK